MQSFQKMPGTQRLVTVEEFERMPSSERYELVEGRLVPMSPVNVEHGRIVLQLGHLLKLHLKNRPEGVAVVEAGFTLARDPDTVRGPDVAFIRSDRMPPPPSRRRGFPAMAPDAVFEVLSPEDRPGAIRKKIAEYLRSGVGLVVLVDPDDKTVVIHRSGAQPVTLRDGRDMVDMGDAIPGFSCRVSEIFE
jgi:Uma2 family endonuclease